MRDPNTGNMVYEERPSFRNEADQTFDRVYKDEMLTKIAEVNNN